MRPEEGRKRSEDGEYGEDIGESAQRPTQEETGDQGGGGRRQSWVWPALSLLTMQTGGMEWGIYPAGEGHFRCVGVRRWRGDLGQ